MSLLTLPWGGIILVAAIVLGAYVLSNYATIAKIQEGENAVINRAGRFKRVAGPGLVALVRGLDEIRHRIDVRDGTPRFEFDDFINGLFVRFEVQMHCRTDLEAAARASGVSVRDLAVYDDTERYDRTLTVVRTAFRRARAAGIGLIEVQPF